MNGSSQKRSGLVPRGTAARSSHAATLVNLQVCSGDVQFWNEHIYSKNCLV